MSNINVWSVIRSGLAAALLLVLLEAVFFMLVQPMWIDVLDELGVAHPGPGVTAAYLLFLVLIGIALVAQYAAIRPRFGPGPRAALLAGLGVWILAWGVGMGSAVVIGIFPAGFAAIVLGWGLIECLAAALVGAMLYREESE